MNSNQLIRWSTVAAVTLIAAVGAWASYSHALDVVRMYGVTGALAYVYPMTVDGLIYASSMVLLDSARRGVDAPGLARWLLGVGIVITLAVNVVAGLHHGAMGAVVSAWPAAALVGSYELLMLMIRREAGAAVTTATVPDAIEAVSADVPEIDSARVLQSVPEIEPATVPASTVPPAPGDTGKTVASRRAPRRAAGHRSRTPERVFADELERGELPSLRAVKTKMNVGTDRARTILFDLQEHVAGQEAMADA